MLAKKIPKPVGNGSSFGGLLAYAADARKASAVEANGVVSLDTAADEMANVARMNSRVKNPVVHWVLSWHELEQPSDQEAIEAAQHLLGKLGYEDHQHVVAVHRDSDNVHAHIVINRVDPETGYTHDPYRDYKLASLATREIEIQQGWSMDRGVYETEWHAGEAHLFQVGERCRAGRSDLAYRLEVYAGERSFQGWLEETDEVANRIDACSSWAELHRTLAAHELELEEVRHRDGGRGLRLRWMRDHKATANASQIGIGYDLNSLEQRFGAFQKSDVQKKAEGEVGTATIVKGTRAEAKNPDFVAQSATTPDLAASQPAGRKVKQDCRAWATPGRAPVTPGEADWTQLASEYHQETENAYRNALQRWRGEYDQLRDHHAREWAELRARQKRERDRIFADRGGFQTRKQRDSADKPRRDRERAELKARHRKERIALKARRPRKVTWMAFLARCQQEGDERAEKALRRVRYREKPAEWEQNGLAPTSTETLDEAAAAISGRFDEGTDMQYSDRPGFGRPVAARNPPVMPQKGSHEELAAMKRVNLLRLAEEDDYAIDETRSTRQSLRLVKGDQVRILQKDAPGICTRYFDPSKNGKTAGHRGDATDWVQQERDAANLNQARRQLRAYLRLGVDRADRPAVAPDGVLAASERPDTAIMRRRFLAGKPAAFDDRIQDAGIDPSLLTRHRRVLRSDGYDGLMLGHCRFTDTDPGSSITRIELICFEERAPVVTTSTDGGRSLGVIGDPSMVNRVVVCESGKDALVLAQHEHDRTDTVYVSLGGSPTASKVDALDALRRHSAAPSTCDINAALPDDCYGQMDRQKLERLFRERGLARSLHQYPVSAEENPTSDAPTPDDTEQNDHGYHGHQYVVK